jgi:hypothetical protein
VKHSFTIDRALRDPNLLGAAIGMEQLRLFQRLSAFLFYPFFY